MGTVTATRPGRPPLRAAAWAAYSFTPGAPPQLLHVGASGAGRLRAGLRLRCCRHLRLLLHCKLLHDGLLLRGGGGIHLRAEGEAQEGRVEPRLSTMPPAWHVGGCTK